MERYLRLEVPLGVVLSSCCGFDALGMLTLSGDVECVAFFISFVLLWGGVNVPISSSNPSISSSSFSLASVCFVVGFVAGFEAGGGVAVL